MPKAALLRSARALAAQRGLPRPLKVVVHCEGGESLSILIPESELPDAPGPKEFSDLERRILDAMPADWITAADIAEKLDQLPAGGQVSSHFRAILTNLVDRRLISSERAGYRKLV